MLPGQERRPHPAAPNDSPDAAGSADPFVQEIIAGRPGPSSPQGRSRSGSGGHLQHLGFDGMVGNAVTLQQFLLGAGAGFLGDGQLVDR